MDRHHGSSGGYRSSSNSQYSSSGYPPRNYEHSQQHSRSLGSSSSHQNWSGERKSYSSSKDDRYSSERGLKRRFEHSLESKKSYDHLGYNQESPRSKYHRSESGQGRSHQHPHHRSEQYEPSSSNSRGRYHSYDYTRPSSHDDGAYQTLRRSNENHRYSQQFTGSSSSGSHRGGGSYHSNYRGRGRGRGANRSQGVNLQTKDYESDKMENSPSPNRTSLAEESAFASDVPSISPSRQHAEMNEEDVSSEKADAVHSDSGKSTRDANDGENEASSEVKQDSAKYSNETSANDEVEGTTTENGVKSSEVDSSLKRRTSTKEVPEHFIRLQCPHCNQRSITYREYIVHLSSQRHARALEKVSQNHRISLVNMRDRQRKEQMQIEAQSTRPPLKMNFCAICKLEHSESRPNHETTELHRIIKNFLMPNCPICKVHFKSRMLYEKHVATLTHIKNKVNMEKSYERRREKQRKQHQNGHNKDELVLDLESFMTLDAVGSVDGDADNGISLEESPVGQEFVKKVEAFFCEVCQRYLSRVEPLEKGLEIHCRTRSHHQAFEERLNGDKIQDRQTREERMENEDSQDMETSVGNLQRTESHEQLLMEAEKDIGGLCDMIGKEDATREESESDQKEEETLSERKEKKEEETENVKDVEFPAVRIKSEKEED